MPFLYAKWNPFIQKGEFFSIASSTIQSSIPRGMDIFSSFHQICMHTDSRTTFSMPFRMLMGAKNVPSKFQWLMDIIFAMVAWRIVPVYIDDIMIFSTMFIDPLWSFAPSFHHSLECKQKVRIKSFAISFAGRRLLYFLSHRPWLI